VRRLPLTVILMVACATAGCTTVSPDPRPSDPLSPPRPAAVAAPADHQGGGTRAPSGPPAHEVLVATRPKDPSATPRKRPAPRVRLRPAAPNPPRGRARSGRRPDGSRPGTTPGVRPAVPVPIGAVDVCRLGQSYGGWQGGSTAARVCRRAYGG
jgi:hypothetical protein